MNRESLNQQYVEDLKKIAKDLKIKITGLKKKDLIDKILEGPKHEEGSKHEEDIEGSKHDYKEKEKLKSLGIGKLKDKAKDLGIVGISKYTSGNKDELVKKILKAMPSSIKPPTPEKIKPPTPEKIKSPKKDKNKSVLYTLGIGKLKEKARELGIVGFSKFNSGDKDELIKKILVMEAKSKQVIEEKEVIEEEEEVIEEEPKKSSSILDRDVLKKHTVAELKKMLVKKHITEDIPKLKNDIVEMLMAEHCDPESEEYCQSDDDVCDMRNKICVKKSNVKPKLAKLVLKNGKTVVGSKEEIDTLNKRLDTVKVPKMQTPVKVPTPVKMQTPVKVPTPVKMQTPESEGCDPEDGLYCSDSDDVCDYDIKKCVKSDKNIKVGQIKIDGRTIVGDQQTLNDLKKRMGLLMDDESVNEEPVIGDEEPMVGDEESIAGDEESIAGDEESIAGDEEEKEEVSAEAILDELNEDDGDFENLTKLQEKLIECLFPSIKKTK